MNIGLQLSYLHYCPQVYCNFRSSEATLNSTSGSLGRSSFEVTESIEASDTTLHTNSTNGGLLRSQVRFQKFIRHLFIFQFGCHIDAAEQQRVLNFELVVSDSNY